MNITSRLNGLQDRRAEVHRAGPRTLKLSALTFMAGALSVLAWAPYGWYILAFAGYGLLFHALNNSYGARSALLIGAAFGFGLHLAGHSWVFAALHGKAGLGMIAASLSTAVYIGYLSAFTALPCALYSLLARRATGLASAAHPWSRCLAFAGLLTIGEWARTLFFNGFTSLSLGYSLIDTWLAGYGPIIGVYGLSWAGFLTASLISTACSRHGTDRRKRTVFLIASLCVFLAGGLLKNIVWTEPYGPPVSYRLIQSNIRQAVKFDPRLVQRHAHQIADMILQEPADVIVTPETAFPMFLNELPSELLPRFQDFARRTRTNIFLGVATAAANSDGYNSLLQLSPDNGSGQMGRYDKVRLMPFGEYTPAGFSWFTRSLSIPLKDLTAGEEYQIPFSISRPGATIKAGTLICHEDLVGRDARDRAMSSNILFNPSNLSWFDGTLAVDQRLQIVRMRALEIGRPILRVANTGITAEIDAAGKVIKSLDASMDGVLTGRAQPTQGTTLYAQYGDVLILVVAALGIFISLYFLNLADGSLMREQAKFDS
jgi:apolipoprotein N-acyltransferase